MDERGQSIACESFEYGSSDGKTRIHARRWDALGSPKGIVQIVHGMAEHIARYDEFARFLAEQGYAVCGNDHIGHGASAVSPDELSVLPTQGAQAMIADVHTLRMLMQGQLGRDVPYILFGHSMGSFIVRVYLARFAVGLAGVVICGTGQPPRTASRMGEALARRLAKGKGHDAQSTLINSLVDGAYGKRIPDARTPLDWINSDPAKVDEYIDDPLCGKMFSVGGYASLLNLTSQATANKTAAAVPAGMPVLFIAGELDPVGDFGKGVRAACAQMEQYSHAQVECIMYPSMRHEILNEPERQRVFDDVLAWLDDVVEPRGQGASPAGVGGATKGRQ